MVAQWAGVLACCLAFGTGCARPAVTAQQPAQQQQQPASQSPSAEPNCDARLATIPYLLKRVKARPEGAPLLPYARLVLDADGERQVAEQVARIEAHPDWHLEVALHMDLETRDEAPPELMNGVEIDCRDRSEFLDCVEDDDGCPESFGWHHDGQSSVIRNAPLDSRTLRIPAGSLAQLDVVVTHAAAHPQERYWVEVHVGRRRTRKEAKVLRGRLAAAIVAELVHRGVVATRLEPIGYGDERPLHYDRRPEHLRENYRFHVTPHGRPDCRAAPAPLCR